VAGRRRRAAGGRPAALVGGAVLVDGGGRPLAGGRLAELAARLALSGIMGAG
jgi:hypothetical protein